MLTSSTTPSARSWTRCGQPAVSAWTRSMPSSPQKPRSNRGRRDFVIGKYGGVAHRVGQQQAGLGVAERTDLDRAQADEVGRPLGMAQLAQIVAAREQPDKCRWRCTDSRSVSRRPRGKVPSPILASRFSYSSTARISRRSTLSSAEFARRRADRTAKRGHRSRRPGRRGHGVGDGAGQQVAQTFKRGEGVRVLHRNPGHANTSRQEFWRLRISVDLPIRRRRRGEAGTAKPQRRLALQLLDDGHPRHECFLRPIDRIAGAKHFGYELPPQGVAHPHAVAGRRRATPRRPREILRQADTSRPPMQLLKVSISCTELTGQRLAECRRGHFGEATLLQRDIGNHLLEPGHVVEESPVRLRAARRPVDPAGSRSVSRAASLAVNIARALSASMRCVG